MKWFSQVMEHGLRRDGNLCNLIINLSKDSFEWQLVYNIYSCLNVSMLLFSIE